MTIIKDVRRILSISVRSIAAVHLFTSSCFELSQTEGASMLPTIQTSGDFCIIDKSFKNGNKIKIGDLIVARKPTQPDSWVCKRITGMPGDIILLDPSRDNINELHKRYNENKNDINNDISEIDIPNLNKIGKFNRDPYDMYIIVPDGHVWVTGDNLSDSVDSRTYSVLPMGLIGGKIIIGIYAPNLLKFNGNYYRFLNNTFEDYI